MTLDYSTTIHLDGGAVIDVTTSWGDGGVGIDLNVNDPEAEDETAQFAGVNLTWQEAEMLGRALLAFAKERRRIDEEGEG